jgi:hypothetical protein
MTEIIATDDQAKTIAGACSPVIVRDAQGNLLGRVVPMPDEHFSAEEILEAKRRAARPGKRVTTAELLAHLRSLAPE